MSEPLRFVPPRVALTDPDTGMISRQWYLFFQGVFTRIGGSGGVSNPDLEASLFEDAGNSETVASIEALSYATSQIPQVQTPWHDNEQAAWQVPPQAPIHVDALTTEVSELSARVAELVKEVESLKQSSPL